MDVKEKLKSIDMKNIVIVAVIIAVIIAAILGITALGSKPNKKKAEEIVKNYLEAMSDGDGDKMLELIDDKGYIIFNEYGEKKFDKKYKDAKKYVNNYLEEKKYDDLEDATKDIAKKFENNNKYYKYDFKEIVSIEKSSKSKKIIIVKAKVKQKTDYATNNNTIKLYLVKVKSQFKVVGVEM